MSNGIVSGWELALTAGIVSLAITLGEERKAELLAHAVPPLPGWTRDVHRSCDRAHQECRGFGVCYEMRHRPRLHLNVWECACVRYEVAYAPILIPFDHQLAGATV